MSISIDPAGQHLETLVADYLRSVPETWTDYDPAALTESQEKAIFLLTAAGMIERRTTLRVRMFGHPVAVEGTITFTGEGGFAEAMEPLIADIWSEWQAQFITRKAGEQKGATAFHSERIGKERWRLTTEGTVARRDLAEGNPSAVFDFVLKHGFFDGRPRIGARGTISQRLPVVGNGKLERMQRVRADAAAPTGVNIANWDAGAQAFAVAFAEQFKAHVSLPSPTPADAPPAGERESEGGKPADRLKGIPLAEAEVRVRDWLAANAKDNPAAITRDAVAAGTAVSAGTVSKTAAWKAFRERRDAEVKPVARDVSLTDAMQAVVPADCAAPAELAALIEEQSAEMADESRRHKRRHGPS